MNLSDLLHKFQNMHIAVIGDAMLDVYHYGRVTKLSQEAPVPVFVEDWVEERPGGAANVTANLEALGCSTFAHYGRSAVTEKHRWIAGHYQVFRSDFDYIQTPLNDVGFLLRQDRLDAIVLSDYAKGMCRGKICQSVIAEAHRRNIPVVVDPKGESWEKFDGATVICPNESEFKSLRVSAPDVDILEKRGAAGIQLHYRGHRLGPLLPARVNYVADTTGCGDVVVACVAAVLAAGGDLEQAATLGNLAAGWAAGQVGTVAVPINILKDLVCESSSSPAASIASTTATAAYSPPPSAAVMALGNRGS